MSIDDIQDLELQLLFAIKNELLLLYSTYRVSPIISPTPKRSHTSEIFATTENKPYPENKPPHK